MSKKIVSWILLFVLAAGLLAGCAAPTTPASPTQAPATAAPAATEPAATTAPTATTEPAATAPAATEPAATEPAASTGGTLILATTTSTQDSGLLDVLLPDFEAETGIQVDVIAVGTGQAITLGEDGNADVLLVHARARENAFMEAGHGVRREDVMYNDFVIVGPADDPAGIKGMTSAAEALKKLADTGTAFISRGDESGTHTKELSIWKAAGIEKPSGDGYISAGQGMGEVLTMTAEQQAYTLSDRATYLARTKAGLDLEILVEGDKALFNPYGVIAVNPDKGPQIHADLADQFINWIISVPVQEKIAAFGEEDFGQSLFIPDSAAWREQQSAAEGSAGLKITGMVGAEATLTEDDLRAMESMQVESTSKSGEKTMNDGVLMRTLLEQAAPAAGAATVVFVASDGFTSEAPLPDVLACEDCIVAFRENGGFNTVMPGFSGKLQVKDLVEIQLK
jgi:tungstate transport system substrate-binding protein